MGRRLTRTVLDTTEASIVPGREADTDLFCLLVKALKPSRVLAPRRMGYDKVSGISLFV
jgi:hypothetical protein